MKKYLLLIGLLIGVMGAHAANAATTFIQYQGTNAASKAITCTSGNLLVFSGWSDGGSGLSLGVSDTASITWHTIGNLSGLTSRPNAMWYGICAGGADTISLTGATNDISVGIDEYSFTGTPLLDASNNVIQTAGSDPVSITFPAASGELGVETASEPSGLYATTTSAGWTVRSTNGNYANTLDNTNLSAGSQTVAISHASGGTGFWNIIVGTIRFVQTTGYSYYRSITVTSTGSVASGTNANFPMLVSSTLSMWQSSSTSGHIQNLTTAPNGGQEAADLIFTSSTPTSAGATWTCNNPLHFETEKYTSSTGAVVDWVNVPSLATSTAIYACYGNSGVTTDQSTPPGTWNSSYVSVWHLPATSTVNYSDSTLNGNNGTGSGAGQASSTGQIDGALTLNPTNSNYILGANTINIGQETISVWMNMATLPASVYLPFGFAQGNGAATYDKDILINAGGQPYFYIYDGATQNTPPVATLTTGTWNYVVATGNGSNISTYVNGVFNASTSAGNSFTGYTGANTLLGGIAPGDNYFNGSLDEADIENTAMTPSWILTEYNNQKSPSTFYAVGAEQTAGGGGGGGVAAFFRNVINLFDW